MREKLGIKGQDEEQKQQEREKTEWVSESNWPGRAIADDSEKGTF